MNDFVVIIPARYESTRFPGKVLFDIHGKPMLQHVWERAMDSKASRVVIATDNDVIRDVAEEFGAEVCMTYQDHKSGTSRITEAVSILQLPDHQVIVNVQADEPFIPVSAIDQVGCFHWGDVTTLKYPIYDSMEINDPHTVKVVTNALDDALYFSRSPIPYNVNGQDCVFKHIGIYGYTVAFLKVIDELESPIAKEESLEQLNALWYGYNIKVIEHKKTHCMVLIHREI